MDYFDCVQVAEGVRLVWLQFDRELIEQGKQLLEQARQAGSADACAFLAQMHRGSPWIWHYCGIEPDLAYCAETLREGITRGSAYAAACAFLWRMWTPGMQAERKDTFPAKVWERVHAVAEQNEPQHQHLLGQAYLSHTPVPGLPAQEQPEKTGIRWLERSLDEGLDLAANTLLPLYHSAGPPGLVNVQYLIGQCVGLGSPQWEEAAGVRELNSGDRDEGLHLLRRAAERGQGSAWTPLGQAYLSGRAVAKDPKKALDCFIQGAKAGDCKAQRELAWFYFTGEYTPQDAARAAYWAGQATGEAAGTKEDLLPLLAHCMLHGLGMPRDVRGALRLVERASNFDDSPGVKPVYDIRARSLLYRDIGELYEKGLSAQKVSLAKAAKAYGTARDLGDEVAAARLAGMEKGLFGRWKRK